jgi:hypothetical protein
MKAEVGSYQFSRLRKRRYPFFFILHPSSFILGFTKCAES